MKNIKNTQKNENYQKHKNIENIDWGKGGRRKLLATRTRTHRKPVKWWAKTSPITTACSY